MDTSVPTIEQINFLAQRQERLLGQQLVTQTALRVLIASLGVEAAKRISAEIEKDIAVALGEPTTESFLSGVMKAKSRVLS